MHYISASDARKEFAKAIDRAQREPVIIQRQGRDVAVMVSPQDFERIRRDHVKEFFRLRDEISAEAKANGLTEEKLAEILADDE